MKKIFIIIVLIICILVTGCGKENKEKIKNKFIEETTNIKGYLLEGTLVMNNNEDNYEYDVTVNYSKQDYYKVTLKNKSNNYEQIILRNKDGVYVVTPSLNKSFKFQSEWPYNNSQSYLLQSLVNDLKNDKEYSFEQKEKNYTFITKVNYPNNRNLFTQKITIDKDMNLKYVEVLDDNNIAHITFKVKSIDKKAVYSNDYFNLDKVSPKETDETLTKKEKDLETTKEIDEALFPLYLPANTNLANRETINTSIGQRVIMTFSGDNSFILVQENVSKEEEMAVTPSYGEPYLLIDTVGALTDTSYTWISNGIEYYIVSDILEQNELLEVAKSINVIATINEK